MDTLGGHIWYHTIQTGLFGPDGQAGGLPVAYHEIWHLRMSWAITASFLVVQPGKYRDKGMAGSQITAEISGG